MKHSSCGGGGRLNLVISMGLITFRSRRRIDGTKAERDRQRFQVSSGREATCNIEPNEHFLQSSNIHQGVRGRLWCTRGRTLKEVRTHLEAVVWSGEWWGGPVCVAGLVAAVVVSSGCLGLGAPFPFRT
ncbi:hypothetical protein E2C01_053576 [Portunus trituberculatus]|uniref:Uncharacterized protein n=1 Tax=Portunus trituberculatus TaxID=210409 RepID=A0A5B7GPQ8_PORTR|nr:hypothetical protein [Portunus trituberculatus]